MKKIFIAALAAITLFAGCAKEVPVSDTKDIKVNFTVAEKDGFGAATKAVKEGWEVGDQILIVFQGKSGWLGWANKNNTITLTKTASGWESVTKTLSLSDLQTGKKFMAVYHMGEITLSLSYDYMEDYTTKLTGYKGGEVLDYISTYNVSGEVLDLGTIKLGRTDDLFQISVKGLTGNNWKMSICSDKKENRANMTIIHMQYGKAFIRAEGTGQYAVYYDATGVEYGGDVLFDFRMISQNSETLVFKLTNGTDTYYYTKTGVTSTTLQGGKAYTLPAISDPKWETE